MADLINNIINQSQMHAGYTINADGGGFCNGVARPLEDKVRVAEVYAWLLKADPRTSTRATARAGRVSRSFATKVIAEINPDYLVDPKQKVRQQHVGRGAGAKTISDEDGEILLAMQRENNWLTLGSYSIGPYNATGKYVSRSVICKWFLMKYAVKGALRVLNQVPINKYSPDNCLCLMEYMNIITQIDPMRLKFCDKKHLKGRELFSRNGWRDPQTRIIEPICIPSDFQNTYTIIGVYGVASETVPFNYILHECTNDAAIFSDVILMMVADETLVSGDVLVMDNAAIHHNHESSALEDVLWDEFEIAIIFLPTRAPELNSIKLLWNIMVQWMKTIDLSSPDGRQRHVAATAAAAIMDSFTHYNVAKCYRKCHYFSY
jgi:hypothetical protein